MQRKLRLRDRSDFNRIYRHGRSFANSQFVVYWSKRSETESFRMGVSVSKKLGGAVVRNRMRRVVKELVRHHADQVEERTDFIVIVRKPALAMKTSELEKSMLHVLRKAGLLKGKPAQGGTGGRSPERDNRTGGHRPAASPYKAGAAKPSDGPRKRRPDGG